MSPIATTKKYAHNHIVLTPMYPGEAKKVLAETAGMWRNRQIDPIRYQRAMRKSYGTLRIGPAKKPHGSTRS